MLRFICKYFIGYDYVDRISYFKKIVKRIFDMGISDNFENLAGMKRSEIAAKFSEIFKGVYNGNPISPEC